MATLENFIFNEFKEIFENRLFPEIAPQDFDNTEKIIYPFCVYSINGIEKQNANCGEPDIYSVQFLIYHYYYDKLKDLREIFIEKADKLAKRVNVSHSFLSEIRAYNLICDYDFYFDND